MCFLVSASPHDVTTRGSGAVQSDGGQRVGGQRDGGQTEVSGQKEVGRAGQASSQSAFTAAAAAAAAAARCRPPQLPLCPFPPPQKFAQRRPQRQQHRPLSSRPAGRGGRCSRPGLVVAEAARWRRRQAGRRRPLSLQVSSGSGCSRRRRQGRQGEEQQEEGQGAAAGGKGAASGEARQVRGQGVVGGLHGRAWAASVHVTWDATALQQEERIADCSMQARWRCLLALIRGSPPLRPPCSPARLIPGPPLGRSQPKRSSQPRRQSSTTRTTTAPAATVSPAPPPSLLLCARARGSAAKTNGCSARWPAAGVGNGERVGLLVATPARISTCLAPARLPGLDQWPCT